ncbi:MAG TPA: amidohydrolase family protein [Candidatus Polarisedimenticolaceae bacterium]|nr:amidohydrolase family protein [Candidatus Polarisedimenticolaceae bacterium]
MAYDLLIRGGRVVDGSGLPSYVADVGVKGGKIVEVGRLNGTAARTIDAGGLAVSPGFIDHHTHLDAQMLWDPYGTCEPQHGVTSVVMGNCGLSLAPVKKGDEDAIVKSFVRVEAIPRFALEQGVKWGWNSYGEYLDALEGKLGINVGGLVGHIAMRHNIMGEEAVERTATAKEVQQMRGLVLEAMEGGALGLSTNRNERHMREDGKPVASRLADDDELFQLCDVLAEHNGGVIETILGRNKIEHFKFYHELAKRTQRPLLWQSLQHRWAEPTLWREQLDAVEPIFREGYQAYGLSHTVPLVRHFELRNCQVFDEFPTWKNLMFLPLEVRKQAFAESETRRKLRADLANPAPTNFHRNWNIVRVEKVVKPENEKYNGKTIAELGAMRNQDPLDAFLDLALEEDLGTVFWNANNGGDVDAMGEILRSPYVLIGTSDAGAHVQFGADFGYCTILLGMWVRERQVMSLEQAVHKLTFHVASIFGLQDRGLLRPGYAADLAIFDPKTVNSHEPEWAHDYPAGSKRLIQRSVGMHYTIVNGIVIHEDSRMSGDLPGQVLRGPLYREQKVAA